MTCRWSDRDRFCPRISPRTCHCGFRFTGWAQVNGAKLVSNEEKEKLDEWYVRNASLWVDLQIALATIKVILKGRVSLAEISADTEQVRSKNIGLHRTNTAI